MKYILLSLKEGTTNFGGGTLFLLEDQIITKSNEGITDHYYQLPDDGMGRTALVRTRDVILREETDLLHAEASHGRCNFTKEEIIRAGREEFSGDFSVRTISFEKQNHSWHLLWRLPRVNKSEKKAVFRNKVTKAEEELYAHEEELEYEIFSIDSSTYEQTSRKFRGPHNLWNLDSLSPGFYEAHLNIGNDCIGVVHFIKHYPVQISVRDTRTTENVVTIEFSQELWNAALEIKLAWGPQSRILFQVRLLELYPEVLWAQANYLEKITIETSSFAWRMYEKEAAGLITREEAKKKIADAFPWVDENMQSHMRNLGEYYSKLKG